MEEETFRADYNIILRCSVCNEGKESLEKLEAHLWNCHLREFPYRCALCGYPSLSSKTLCLHFEQVHDRNEPVLFKRSIVNELRLREMIARSILFPMEEQIFDSIDVPSNDEESLEQVPIVGQSQIQQIVPQEVETTIADEAPFDSMTVNDFGHSAVEEEIVNEAIQQQTPQNVITVEESGDGEGVFVAHASYGIYEDDEYGIQYVDEDGNQLDAEELITEDDSFQENMLPRLSRLTHVQSNGDGEMRPTSKPRRRATIHQCEECGKILKYPSKIAEHLRSHTKEKPHICGECGTCFSQKGALKCHLRLHTGERPYACTWECGRSFVSASARQMHEKMHTGEKRFVCAVCGHLFSKKFHMQRHMSTLHPTYQLDSSTGLDAAGEDAAVLVETVTSVIEDVRKARLKKKKRVMSHRSTSSDLQPMYS